MRRTYPFMMCLVLSTSAALLSSCSMQRSGPRSSAYKDQAAKVVEKKDANIPYTLVDVSAEIVKGLVASAKKPMEKDKWPQSSVARPVTIMPGDSIRLSVFESEANGLFIQENTMRTGNFVTIPQLFVEDTGDVMIPYVGKVHVQGMYPTDVAKHIEQQLVNKAIDPKVVVEFVSRNGYRASVIGDVNSAGKFVIDHERERILDLLAKAGGSRFLGFETFITLQRQGIEYTTLLDNLIENPKINHFVEPDDVLYVFRQPKMFQVYGAVQTTGMHQFTKRTFTLTEAMGLAKGMNDNMADPEEIYVYRYEDKKTYEETLKLPTKDIKSKTVPVIYSLDLNKADGFFLAQHFPVQEHDIIYVANAETAEFRKFLNILGSAALVSAATDSALDVGR